MIASLDVGGSQTMMMNIYRNIDREKIQFDFIIDQPKETYFAPEIRSLGGKVFTLPAFRGYNAGEVKRDWNNFFYTHPEYRVLHSHSRSYASLYLPVAKQHGVKTIIHSHSTNSGSGIKGAVILRGTTIGDNCMIGAGCIVKGDIPANSIVTQKRETVIRPWEVRA